MKLRVMEHATFWGIFSSVLTALSIVILLLNTLVRGAPFNFGIDFTGGTTITLRFAQPIEDVGTIRKELAAFHLEKSTIQRLGEERDIIIRSEPLPAETRKAMTEKLIKAFPGTELLEADTIGPVVGKELRTQAIWSLLLASLGITLYVSFRFRFEYAISALLALYHDTIITIGVIALFWRTVDTPFIAAILTVMGYSINDTIIIFDRLRENLKDPTMHKKGLREVMNESIDQTLARSINTVLAVLFVNLALLLFGGATIKDFALTLFIGFAVGSYSSIFLASPILFWLEKKKST